MSTQQPASWTPRSYQKTGVKLMISQACAGLLYKPGRGKTSVVYMAIRILLAKQFVSKVLVIAPLRPMRNVWPRQKDDYEDFKHLRVGVMHGELKDDVLVSDDYDVYVVNPDGLDWLFATSKRKVMGQNGKMKTVVDVDPVRLKWLKQKFQMLVIDESTDFRDYSTQRFSILKSILPSFKRRYIMTGTPTPKGLLDLFGQIYVLDQGDALGRFITHYRANYFVAGGHMNKTFTPQPGAKERIMDKVKALVQVVEDPIDLPSLTFNDIFVELPEGAWHHYKFMEKQLVALLESGTVVAANAAVASSKCRQIANGGLYDSEEKGVWHEVHDEKIEALAALIDQLQGASLLVTYEFRFDLERIQKKLKIPCISTGNAKADDLLIQRFAAGEIQVVCGHPQSISLGIDGLQKSCADIAMLGVTWNLLHYEQVINRVWRSGSNAKKVTVHRILAKNTVDERVLKVLDSRDKEQKDFMSVLAEIGHK